MAGDNDIQVHLGAHDMLRFTLFSKKNLVFFFEWRIWRLWEHLKKPDE